LSWQFSLQRLWEKIVHGIGTTFCRPEILTHLNILFMYVWFPSYFLFFFDNDDQRKLGLP
jgi:hypothetical protein